MFLPAFVDSWILNTVSPVKPNKEGKWYRRAPVLPLHQSFRVAFLGVPAHPSLPLLGYLRRRHHHRPTRQLRPRRAAAAAALFVVDLHRLSSARVRSEPALVAVAVPPSSEQSDSPSLLCQLRPCIRSHRCSNCLAGFVPSLVPRRRVPLGLCLRRFDLSIDGGPESVQSRSDR